MLQKEHTREQPSGAKRSVGESGAATACNVQQVATPDMSKQYNNTPLLRPWKSEMQCAVHLGSRLNQRVSQQTDITFPICQFQFEAFQLDASRVKKRLPSA